MAKGKWHTLASPTERTLISWGWGWGALPAGAAEAESSDLPLGILSGRDQGCKSIARSHGRVTPHPWLWLLWPALQFTPCPGR